MSVIRGATSKEIARLRRAVANSNIPNNDRLTIEAIVKEFFALVKILEPATAVMVDAQRFFEQCHPRSETGENIEDEG